VTDPEDAVWSLVSDTREGEFMFVVGAVPWPLAGEDTVSSCSSASGCSE
jgi:hypothetical protein